MNKKSTKKTAAKKTVKKPSAKKTMEKTSAKKPVKRIDTTEVLTVYDEGESCVSYNVNPNDADSIKAALRDSGYLCSTDDPDEIAEEIVRDGLWWDGEISFCLGNNPPHVL